jgi:predicted nucleic acid-binding protein
LIIYPDSSFIVSYYLQDAHSPETDRRMNLFPSVLITPLNHCELAHAISKYVFRGKLSPPEAQQAWADFQQDCAQGVWIFSNLPESTWETSISLARKYGPTISLRTLDSLHVACALELKAKRFWTFDDRQARLAESVGLNTSA